jgi:hypothetical protein
MYDWYFELPAWLRAGVGVVLLGFAVLLFMADFARLAGVGFFLGILALAGAIPNRTSEWGDY